MGQRAGGVVWDCVPCARSRADCSLSGGCSCAYVAAFQEFIIEFVGEIKSRVELQHLGPQSPRHTYLMDYSQVIGVVVVEVKVVVVVAAHSPLVQRHVSSDVQPIVLVSWLSSASASELSRCFLSLSLPLLRAHARYVRTATMAIVLVVHT